jgi:hypothetical protein
MSNSYMASPRASTTPFLPVATALIAATIKTVLQVAVPATTDVVIIGWGLSFDNAAGGTQVPGICSLLHDPTACTGGTALTPEPWGNSLAPASLCVGGAALTAYSLTEVTPTAPTYLDTQEVSPQSGYGVFFPADARPRVQPSRFIRIRCTLPAAANVIPWVLWDEPAQG